MSIYAFDRGKGNFTTKYIFQFARILAFCFLGEILHVPAAAGVMELWAEMGEMLLPILVAIIPVTVLVMVSAGKTTQALTGRKKKEADNDAAAE